MKKFIIFSLLMLVGVVNAAPLSSEVKPLHAETSTQAPTNTSTVSSESTVVPQQQFNGRQASPCPPQSSSSSSSSALGGLGLGY